jgi:hypothetical protein
MGEMARSVAVLRRNTVELLEIGKTMQADILAATLEKEQELTAAQRNFLATYFAPPSARPSRQR